MDKIRITAVSYLNTKPLLYGLLNSELQNQIELSLDIPSECARKLKAGEVDLALSPVAIIPELNEWQIVSDYCIGTEGAVKTVNIYADCPIEEVEELYLDHHSRSSVALARVLLQHHWKKELQFLKAEEGYIEQIKGARAGVVIGDRTIDLEGRFPYVYDLAEVWKSFTGLPFVFAAWISNKALPDTFVSAFNEALQKGIASIAQLNFLLPSPNPAFSLEEYFTKYISYHLDQPKRKALDLFLKLMSELPPLEVGSRRSEVGGRKSEIRS